MNDDFIYRALPKVRREFALSLYSRISSTAPRPIRHSLIQRRRWLSAALIILGLLILVAWSQMRLWIRYVPIGDLWIVQYEKMTASAPEQRPAIPFVPTALPTPKIFDLTQISPTEMAELASSFKLYFPTWIPGDYQQLPRPSEMTAYEQTLGLWSKETGERIRLFMAPRAGGMRPYAPTGMWTEVQVNDEPAILIYGRLALTSVENPRAQRMWDETLGLQLHWIMGEDVYALETFGPYLSEEELIQMAESMQELKPPWDALNP